MRQYKYANVDIIMTSFENVNWKLRYGDKPTDRKISVSNSTIFSNLSNCCF